MQRYEKATETPNLLLCFVLGVKYAKKVCAVSGKKRTFAAKTATAASFIEDKSLEDMAIAIRSIPTLYGEDAERFLLKAEEAEQNPQRTNISHNISLVKDFLRKQNL
ncbi:MAG: hypothetical protein K2I86_08085 [Prevotella sp.]|nr:hypothetical protein [Prevotella sp.]